MSKINCTIHPQAKLFLANGYLACPFRNEGCDFAVAYPPKGSLCFMCNTPPNLPPTELHGMIGLNPICHFCNGLLFLVEEWAKMFLQEWIRQNRGRDPCQCCVFDFGNAPQLFPHPPFSSEEQERNSRIESLTVLSMDLAIVKQFEQAVHSCHKL